MSKQKRIHSFLDSLYDLDFKEYPPTTDEVLCQKKFLGTLTEGGNAVYPVWKEKLHEIHTEDSRYLIVLTGAIGTGKTRAAIWGMIAGMARILCLKDPWKFFGLSAGGKMAIVFFNLTKTLSESGSYRLLQNHLIASSWFRERGILRGKEPNQWLEFPLFDYKIASPNAKGFGTIGESVILAIMDEVDSPTESEKQKIKVLQAYENTVRRFESRFVDDVYKESIGKFFLVASKQEELSFINAFIAERRDSSNVYIVDIPYWITRPEKGLSGRKFSIMVGDVYTPSCIISTSKEKLDARIAGYDVVDVPIEFLENFERDINGALKDIAGISVSAIRQSKLFPSEKIINGCYDKEKQDPMSMTTIGIGLDDDIDLMNYVDFSKIRMPRTVPRYIHNDVAYSGDGDAMSLAMSGIKSWKKVNVENPDGTFEVRRVPIIETDFVFRLKARPGDKVPLFKVRKFILDLKLAGFFIKKYTADLSLLSEDTKQILTRSGIDCGYVSLDRDIKPYYVFLDVVAEKRWICHRCDLLHFELKNLIHDKDRQKIDHPDKIPEIVFLKNGETKEVVMKGSKDMADGVAGSVYAALEDTDTLPVDAEIMANVLKIVQSVSGGDKPRNWILDKDTAFSGQAEQFVLHDIKGRYWHWVKETPDKRPKLNGPYPRKPLDIQVVEVADPKTFIPGVAQKTEVDNKTSQFLSVLKGVRERS
jgi:hypothetical protein